MDYQELNRELNKIKALDIFKTALIDHIIKYYISHNVTDLHLLNAIKRQMTNNFTNWFFNMNIEGKLLDFIPIDYFSIQDNLDYLFKNKNIKKIYDFDKNKLYFDIKSIKNVVNIIKIKVNIKNKVEYELISGDVCYSLLTISRFQYDHLTDLYNGPSDKFDEYLSIILSRYKFLGGMNNHLSIPPEIYSYLGINFELFGTPFNTTRYQYCSPFPDYEKYFGSVGSFFDWKFKDHCIYGANPPFSANLIEKMSIKFLDILETNSDIQIYLTVPQWEIDFKGLDIIKKTKYCKYIKSLNCNRYPYYDYFREKYVPAINTYIILLSNNNNNNFKTDFIKYWPKGPIATLI